MTRIIVEKNIAVPMRDGAVLRADLYRADTPEKLPVLLNRTPYNKSMPMVFAMTLDAFRAAEAGYNVLVQDCRGRFASDGVFNCFTDEARDGYDTIEWAAHQPWSDGKVGTYGASYMGATQWLAATQTPPSLKAMVPSITASDYHDGWTYQGGAFALFFNVSWTMAALAPARLLRERENNPAATPELIRTVGSIDTMLEAMQYRPLAEFPIFRAGAPYFFDWLKHPAYDDYWRALSIEASHAKINVPALNIGGWYDIFQGGTIRNYLGMRARGATDAARAGQRLMIGPWNHAVPFANQVGAVDFGYQTGAVSADIDGQQLRFFDRHLKGKNVAQAPNVRIFVMGINQWRDESEWPIPGTEFRRYFLHSRGRANSAAGDGALSTDSPGSETPDSFLYNPLDPVPTAGGGLCCYPAALLGRRVRSGGPRDALRRAGIFDRAARRGSGSDRTDRAYALRVVVGAGHRFHREAGRCWPVRDGEKSDRRDYSRALSRVAIRGQAADAGQSRGVQDRHVEHGQRVQGRASDPARSQLVELSALRSAIRTPATSCSPTPKCAPRCKPSCTIAASRRIWSCR